MRDTGNYTCVARSLSGGSFRENVPLTIIGARLLSVILETAVSQCSFSLSTAAARITSSFPEVVTVRSGESVQLQCDATGPPKPDVYWTKGSTRVGNSTSAILKIANASQQDSGIYRCHAVNHLGSDEKEIRLGKDNSNNCT